MSGTQIGRRPFGLRSDKKTPLALAALLRGHASRCVDSSCPIREPSIDRGDGATPADGGQQRRLTGSGARQGFGSTQRGTRPKCQE